MLNYLRTLDFGCSISFCTAYHVQGKIVEEKHESFCACGVCKSAEVDDR